MELFRSFDIEVFKTELSKVESIETERLVLRSIKETDAEDILKFTGDENTAYWAGMEPQRTLSEVLSEFQDVILVRHFGIALKDCDKVIGIISVSDGFPDDHIGYLLSVDHRDKGYMTEAVKAVCKKYFEVTERDQLMCQIRKDNLPSRRVAEKCGFIQDPNQTYWTLNHYRKPLDDFFLYRENGDQ